MKVVLDTNVIIASLFSDGAAFKVVRLALDKKIEVLISDIIVSELKKVLQNPKERFELSEQEINDTIMSLLAFAKIVKLKTKIEAVRDIKDNHILECAFDGNAEYILSYDADLLSLNSFKEIKILKPEEFFHLI